MFLVPGFWFLGVYKSSQAIRKRITPPFMVGIGRGEESRALALLRMVVSFRAKAHGMREMVITPACLDPIGS